MVYKARTKIAKKCTECGKIIHHWNKSNLCSFHYRSAFKQKPKEKEKARRYAKIYREKNKDKIKKYAKKYAQKNKDKLLLLQNVKKDL